MFCAANPLGVFPVAVICESLFNDSAGRDGTRRAVAVLKTERTSLPARYDVLTGSEQSVAHVGDDLVVWRWCSHGCRVEPSRVIHSQWLGWDAGHDRARLYASGY